MTSPLAPLAFFPPEPELPPLFPDYLFPFPLNREDAIYININKQNTICTFLDSSRTKLTILSAVL